MPENQLINTNHVVDAQETLGQPLAPKITLDQLVNIAIEQDASDIHFSEGGKVALRVGGKFVFIENVDHLSQTEVQVMIDQMLPDEAQQKRLRSLRELDFSYVHGTGVSFRVNAFYAQGYLSVVMRMISKHVPTMQELGIPEGMKQFLSLREGLILVTGTTGSGKSTTIQSMLEHVNKKFSHHVITIENPIEHVFKEEKSIFSQRELGKDTLSFASAIHAASREDPNIVVVSEIRDKETLNAVLALVEMGHLVIAALTTKNVHQTIEHIISMYPHQEQQIMQDRFSENLLVILSQDLLDRVDQVGRMAIFETLVATNGVKNIIKHGMLNQLRTAMESGQAQGMMTMDQYAGELARRGYVSREDALSYIKPVE